MKVIPIITLLNIIVYCLWAFPFFSPEFMAGNFLVSWDAVAEGRFWVLITSVFSHNLFLHFFINMYVLNSFGPFVERVLGRKRFTQFYILAGTISSIGHAMVSNLILDAPELPALGASGAIAGVILLFSFLFPREKILLLGLIPLPALWGAVLFIGIDIWGLMAQAEGGGFPIGHGAHLGGAVTGIIYYFWLRSQKRQ